MSISITTDKETRQPLGRGSQDREAIARRAYQLWQAEGRPAGRDLDYWLRAEAEIESGRPFRPPASMVASGATSNGETVGKPAASAKPPGKEEVAEHLSGQHLGQDLKQPKAKTGIRSKTVR